METATVRFGDVPGGGICIAPQYVAAELLRPEGITDFQNVPVTIDTNTWTMMAEDQIDFSLDFSSLLTVAVDKGMPVTALAGVHPGCYALFAREGIASVVDLRGKRVGVGPNPGSEPHVFVSAMATYVGLDPTKDIEWVQSEEAPLDLFLNGQVDAMLAFPPEVQDLKARGIGHVVVDSSVDRPWSQYYCCMILANTRFVEKYPVATKRVVRAVLKAADICASDPGRVVRLLVDQGYTGEQAYADAALRELPFAAWRDFDPEDTVRFFALRLREAGMIESSPQDIIARGTDWRFLDEVKRELKA